MVVVLAASAHRRVKKTKDLWRDAVDEDDDVMRLMIIQLRFRFRFFCLFGLVFFTWFRFRYILPFDLFLGGWTQCERWSSYWLRAAHHQ